MSSTYSEICQKATGYSPFPYQQRFAESSSLPDVARVPTGMGKTSAAVMGWIWRRCFAEENINKHTPRRLVYCLPMRTLVEQTKTNVEKWLANLGEFPGKPEVIVLMGGESFDKWDIHPEINLIIIGTQDMLLSRALNRGYGISKYRWAVNFGLLNNDCLWVYDEVQLMGVGIKTGLQLQQFRDDLGVVFNTHTIRMSATIAEDTGSILELNDEDRSNPLINKKLSAKKAVSTELGPDEIEDKIISSYENGKKVIVILNTVKRAVELYKKIQKKTDSCVLLHSRFRPSEKERLREKLGSKDTKIIISTQVIEAGVDITSDVLITELAPWSSLVQRFGRCNRDGESKDAEIYVIDVDDNRSAPYNPEDFDVSRNNLNAIESASLNDIESFSVEPVDYLHVIRDSDIIDLFDTSSDLSGNEVDVSRFIRDVENERDLSVFWRDVDDTAYSLGDESLPSNEELCQVPINELKKALEQKSFTSWMWSHYDGTWTKVTRPNSLSPNSLIMISSSSGMYDEKYGWDLKSKKKVTQIGVPSLDKNNSYQGDDYGNGFESLSEHTAKVHSLMEKVTKNLELPNKTKEILSKSALWHDVGKAHEQFQRKIISHDDNTIVAKAPKEAWKHWKTVQKEGGRKYFRHELASAICALENGESDLVSYLVAAHHGKIRLSIRSLPDEDIPLGDTLFARGVWDGDIIPELEIGGLIIPETALDLSYMQLGEGIKGESWTSRMLSLRDEEELGIFRLSYYEALMKAADERASGGEL